MAKALISILGTNDYLECKHSLNGVTKKPVKYVQEDLVDRFCNDWSQEDEIRIFLTDDAEKKNWANNGHKDRKGDVISNSGLKERLEELNLAPSIKPVKIPIGNSEDEIWEIFEIIFNTFRKDEEIILDVTHSFRSLPLLLSVMLNYSKMLKNIKIIGVYYAAFETLGPIPEAKNIPVEDRIAPIFNLTSFSKLLDWTLAAHNFTRNGISKELKQLTTVEIKPILARTEGKDEAAGNLRSIVNSVDRLTNSISISRGKDIVNYDYQDLQQKISQLVYSSVLIKPLAPLLREIETKLQRFENNKIYNGISAVEWCIEHGMMQQAITILQETLISIIVNRLGLNWKNKKYREIVSSAFHIHSKDIPKESWTGEAAKNSKLTEKFLQDEYLAKLQKEFNSLSTLRNDVNHAGFLDSAKNAQSIFDKFNHIFKTVKNKI